MRRNGAHPRPAQPGCAGVSPAYSDVTNHGSAGSVPLAVLRERDAHAPGHQCRFAFVVHPQVLRERNDRAPWHLTRAGRQRSGASPTSRTPTLQGAKKRARSSPLTSHPSLLTPHSSPLASHSSLLTPHPSLLTPHPSLLTPHSSLLTPHSSLLTPHSSLLTPHPSLLTPHSSKLI